MSKESNQIVLLNSKHYDNDSILDLIRKSEDFDALDESRAPLEVLVRLSRTEIASREFTPPEYEMWMHQNPLSRLRKFLTDISYVNVERDEFLKSIYKNNEEMLPYERWSTESWRNEHGGTQGHYLSFVMHRAIWTTPSAAIAYVVVITLGLPLLLNGIFTPNALNIDGTRLDYGWIDLLVICLGCILTVVPNPIRRGVLRFITTPSRLLAKAGRLDRWCQSRVMENEIHLSKEEEHLAHLSLGQVFQVGDTMFRLMGFISGLDNALMLRTPLRGTSDILDDYIDRRATPQLVALHIDEFIDIYLGNDIVRTTHWWSNRLLTPLENEG